MSSDFNAATQPVESKAQAYVYPAPLAPGTAPKPSSPAANPSTLERLWAPEPNSPAQPLTSEEQIRARETQARNKGREEGLAQARAEFEKKLAIEKQNLLGAAGEFIQEREKYFHRVESEVVGLTLAIARKILHREAQVDPLLLAGVVRVGLDNIAAGTRVRLRVHPDQVPVWREFFSSQPDLKALPELMGDATLGPGRCILETELGSTDLTLETQLKEIEQGFFDLLAKKPNKA
jgi:flagellar assembly protein FliH